MRNHCPALANKTYFNKRVDTKKQVFAVLLRQQQDGLYQRLYQRCPSRPESELVQEGTERGVTRPTQNVHPVTNGTSLPKRLPDYLFTAFGSGKGDS